MTEAALPVSEIAPSHQFDVKGLETYLAPRIDGFGKGLRAQQFQGGASNPTFLLTTETDNGVRRFVMRKKPPGVLLASAHQIDREYKAMDALGPTDVPVPVMRHLCEDPAIIGTAFYVMDFVPGRILSDPTLPALTAQDRAAVYDDFNATLAKLHSVDFQAVGLGDWNRSGDFIDRQLARFTKQYRGAESEHIPEMEELIKVLPQHIPGNRRIGIVHGDYKLGNVMIHPTEPKVVAVLDWELATIGDPLADLAFSCFPWHRTPGERGAFGDITGVAGIPTEAEYIAAYCKRTGRDGIEGWNFYLAFGMFRLASIMQGVYQRVLSGTVASNFAAVNTAPAMARDALHMLRTAHL